MPLRAKSICLPISRLNQDLSDTGRPKCRASVKPKSPIQIPAKLLSGCPWERDHSVYHQQGGAEHGDVLQDECGDEDQRGMRKVRVKHSSGTNFSVW